MSVLFRINPFNAALGCLIALALVYPRESEAWLTQNVKRPVQALCAEGLPICNGFGLEDVARRLREIRASLTKNTKIAWGNSGE